MRSLFSLLADISALYLSWYGDPATTMTIQWHTLVEERSQALLLQQGEEWEEVPSEETALPTLLVHKATLDHLEPNTEYAFKVGDSPTYRFRTAPTTLTEPLRFVIGGDIYANRKLFRRMAQTAIEHDPLFAVLGGDIAYAINNNPFRSSGLRRWSSFFKEWKEAMITSNNRIIPFLIVPGNHDITPHQYELFFQLFAFPKKQLYRTVDFGSYLTLFLLDTGHFQPIDGRQPIWLEKALASHMDVPYRFAIYHEAGYPSYYPFEATTPRKIRAHWVPLFEKYHLLAAFENHNHAFKRTYPLLNNKVDPQGVIYLGDGSWGVIPRITKDAWYLDKRGRKNALFVVELTPEKGTIEALTPLNQSIDRIEFNN